MRPGAGFNATAAKAVVAPAIAGSAAHSAWHSPVPYLFGGLAAMLGLIAFALLILACSYWKLSGASSFGDRSNKGDDEAEKKVTQEVAMSSIKDAEQNGEHSESRREREEHHIPEV
ncbi:protein GLUTAMINE DUMPER 3-like [Panicum miliaceum]|uniref:Protein GLUTAMINE DUMPER 3-like n=1 Tax=Panicum miliaceum TaxID=4540 RepID=A0A3L6RKT5_PANMI|nr:protein GLUTAMINE DUMPER 3-like [Panicum miliaceum]